MIVYIILCVMAYVGIGICECANKAKEGKSWNVLDLLMWLFVNEVEGAL